MATNKLKPKKILKIGVLIGGPSAEHGVSLATGRNVLDNLDRSKYELVTIKISKDKKWFLNGRLTNEAKALKSCDVVFNALHGTFGEDGRVQALMEYYGARYTGSGICGSALAMDKLRSREIFKLAGFQAPKTLKIRKGESYQALLNVFVNKISGFPVVVKPCSNGSSVGVSIATNQVQLDKAIKAAFGLEKKVLIEEFIEGREVTCGVLENFFAKGAVSAESGGQGPASGWNGNIAALPVTEIIPRKGNKFFNYNAKYKTGHSKEITPARIDEGTTQKVQEIAVKAHQLLGCKTYSRTDMIIRNDDIFILEVNTLPGLTANSLVPKAAQVAGLTFSQLLDKIIQSSLV